MPKDMKKEHQVAKTYNIIADWFYAHRDKSLDLERKIIEMVQPYLSPGSSIFDVGCGTGEPIASYFLKQGYAVTGLDASIEMIQRCRERFPNAHWLVGDMRERQTDQEFDLVIVWHSFFHLPKEDQPAALGLLCSYVKPNGLLVFTSGPAEGEVWSENGGENLFHASLSPDAYQSILARHGFGILFHQAEDPDCGDATVWVAQRQG